jgi:hypothetical protein
VNSSDEPSALLPQHLPYSLVRGLVRPYDPAVMACRDPQRPDNQTARQLVQSCLPQVEVCLHDDGSEPMMYDLDLRWPMGGSRR